MQKKPSSVPKLPIRRYASAGGVVYDPRRELVLVLFRSRRKDASGRIEVRLPKGHIESGESRRESARREVREETGLSGLKILADLGHQTVTFNWRGAHYVRNESCFLFEFAATSQSAKPEKQFKRQWLTWEDALQRLTFEAEREWVRKAHRVVRGLQQN